MFFHFDCFTYPSFSLHSLTLSHTQTHTYTHTLHTHLHTHTHTHTCISEDCWWWKNNHLEILLCVTEDFIISTFVQSFSVKKASCFQCFIFLHCCGFLWSTSSKLDSFHLLMKALVFELISIIIIIKRRQVKEFKNTVSVL